MSPTRSPATKRRSAARVALVLNTAAGRSIKTVRGRVDGRWKGFAVTFVTTTCARCGIIEVPLERVLLRFCEPDGAAVCVLRCPACGGRFVKAANDAMTSAMVALGVEVSTIGTDVSAGRPMGLGRITDAELAAFCERLDGDEVGASDFERLPF